jgi:metal-responsive CopG/Arc/MetJ family transcriptional regulator
MAAEIDTVRTHVVLPRSLVAEIDRRVGQRKRSEYIANVLEEPLHVQRQLDALERYAGVLDPADYPHLATAEKTFEWVRRLRQESDDSWNRTMGQGGS